MNKSRAIKALGSVAVVAAVASLVVGAAPANAADNESDLTADLIASVAPDQGAVVSGTSTSAGTRVAVRGTDVVVPSDPTKPISASSSSAQFSVSLPKELNVEHSVAAGDGTIVFAGKDGSTSAAVQVLSPGTTRIQTILPNSAAPTRYTYAFPNGYSPAVAADGSVVVNSLDGSGYAIISAPWARDAHGHGVPTHYETAGGNLVQVVQPTPDTVFPVVADPSWAWINAAYGLKLTRSETHTLSTAAGVTGMCPAFIRMGGAPAATLCGIYGAYIFTQANIAENAKPKQCIFAAVVPAPLVERIKC